MNAITPTAGSSQSASQSSTPSVSIILTVYRRTKYLPESLASALDQSYPNFEIIVADDSGTAAAREIVASYGNKDRLYYLPNPETLGIASSLKRAVERARGEFIAVLNDDDIWERDFLAEVLVPLQADPNCVVAFSDHWLVREDGVIDPVLSDRWSKTFERASLPAGEVSAASEFSVLKLGVPIANAAIFRKNAIDWSLVVPAVTGAYDYWISCLLAATGKPIHFVSKRLTRWRVHGGMETQRRSHDKGENLVYIFSQLLKRNWFPNLDAELQIRLADALMAVGRDKLYFDRIGEARHYFWQCFQLSFRLRALANALATLLPTPLRVRVVQMVRILKSCAGGRSSQTGDAVPAILRSSE